MRADIEVGDRQYSIDFSKGVDISISLTEKVFAWIFSVEKKIFNKASKQKWIYNLL